GVGGLGSLRGDERPHPAADRLHGKKCSSRAARATRSVAPACPGRSSWAPARALRRPGRVTDYNHARFHRDLLLGLRFQGGPRPGEDAPPFDLPTTVGTRFRLADQRSPVLLTFASASCPFTLGALPALRAVHHE